MMKLAKEHEHFKRDLFFKLGFLLSQECDALIQEDLEVQNLIQKGETKRRRLMVHDSSPSELRTVLGAGVREAWENSARTPSVQHIPRVLPVWGNQPEPDA